MEPGARRLSDRGHSRSTRVGADGFRPDL